MTLPKERELVVEGTIQRFETLIEVFWKLPKRALEFEGEVVKTPRESVKAAFRVGWLSDEQLWLDMLDSRNTTSHQYLDDELVEQNYEDIKKNVPVFRQVFDILRGRYPNPPDGETT